MRHIKLFGIAVGLLIATQFSTISTSAVGQEYQTKPLYSFLSSKGYRLYKVGATLPPGLSDHPWKNEGIVAHVVDDAAPGTHPVYRYAKTDDYGVRFSYSKDENASGSGWVKQDVAFYAVTTSLLPQTARLLKLYLPAKETNPGQKFTGMVPGTDAVFLTTDPAKRREALNAGWTGDGNLGYVWNSPPKPEAIADLIVEKTNVINNEVVAVIMNRGQHNVSSNPGVDVQLLITDRQGKQIFSDIRSLGGISPGQRRPVSFDTAGHNVAGRLYQIRVDHQNKVKESNDSNNSTEPTPIMRLKINPLPPGYVTPPSFNLTAIQSSPTAAQPKRTIYTFDIWNWDKKFNPEAFQSMENILPPNPCGSGKTNARLVARLMVIRNGPPIPLGCKPLNTQADLRTLEFALPAPLGDADKVEIALVDTALDAKYVSSPYPVGLFGVANSCSQRAARG